MASSVPIVSVSGEAEISADPELAVVWLSVSARESTQEATQMRLAAQRSQLAALLEKNGYTGTSFESAGSNAAQAVIAAAETLDDGYSGDKIRDALEGLCGLDTYGLGEEVCYSKDSHDGYGTDALTMLVVTHGKFATYTP